MRKMKYPRGTVLKLTPKALRQVKDMDDKHRFIVLTADEAILYREGEVLASSLYKTHDSFVTLANETVPAGMTYDLKKSMAPNKPSVEQALATEFGYTIK